MKYLMKIAGSALLSLNLFGQASADGGSGRPLLIASSR